MTTERLRIDTAGRDQYGRDADDCRISADLAEMHATAARRAVSDVRASRVLLARAGGERLLQRLERSADVFERVAARDRSFAVELDAAARTRTVHAVGANPDVEPIL